MDKGREGVRLMLDGLHIATNEGVTLDQLTDAFIEALRAHGWLHEEDVVPHRFLKGQGYTDIGPGHTDKERNTDLERQEEENEKRRNTPATVRDLIGRKG